jgi:hypothetical protein
MQLPMKVGYTLKQKRSRKGAIFARQEGSKLADIR